MPDIYILGFSFFLLLAAFFINKSIKWKSQGYRLLGISSVLFSLGILLLKFNYYLSILFAIIAFFLNHIGTGILINKEQRANAKKGKAKRNKNRNQKLSMLGGIIIIIMGLLGLFLREEKVFPVLLIIGGIMFIYMSYYYSDQKNQNPQRQLKKGGKG
jgi:threonine/homoserine/homoserine lactone efflux protein